MTPAGFSAEYRDDGIIVYHFHDVNRESIDMWYDTTTRHDAEAALRGQPILRIIKLERMLIPTPYAFSRAKQAVELTPPNLREALAVVVPDTLAFQLIKLFINRLPPLAKASTRVFHNEEAALRWLRQRGQDLMEKNKRES